MITKVSFKQLSAVTAVAAVVIVAIWYVALLSPADRKVASARRQTAAANQQASSLSSQVAQLRALERNVSSDKAKLAQYNEAVPATPELSSVLREIQTAATNASVEVSSVNPVVPIATASGPAAPGSVPGVQTIPVSIAASGQYANLMAFVTTLNGMPRTLVVQSLNLSGTGSVLSAQISSDIFDTNSPGH